MATSATSEIEEAIADALGGAIEVNVDLQGESVTIEDSNGNPIVPIQASDQPFDVSDAVVTVTDDGGLAIGTLPEPIDVSASTVSVTDDGTFDINSLPEPLDVSGATVTVTDDGDLTVSDSQGNVIEEPLDVSDATVTVTDDGSLNIAGSVSVGSLPEPVDVSGATVSVTDDGTLDVNSLPEPLDVSAGTVSTDETGPGNANYKSVTVDGSATQVLTTTSNRKGFIVQNTDANADVYLGFDNNVTTGNGFIIPSNLGTFSDDRYTGPVYMVTGGASVDVRVQELLL